MKKQMFCLWYDAKTDEIKLGLYNSNSWALKWLRRRGVVPLEVLPDLKGYESCIGM